MEWIVRTMEVPEVASQFRGAYAPAQWILRNQNTDGFVDTVNAPSSITLVGGNAEHERASAGTTTYLVMAVASGTISFHWQYTTLDAFGVFDPFVFRINGVEQFRFDSPTQFMGEGVFVGTVNAGDYISFEIETLDNRNGRSSITVSQFDAPQPPRFSGLKRTGLTFVRAITSSAG